MKKSHPIVYQIVENERKRQSEVINLIPSENYASPAVREALGSWLVNKYAEGKPGSRYYFGNQNADKIELYAQKLLYRLFRISPASWQVNVQPYSGSPANFAVYAALLNPGDTVLAMALEAGGHLTHGHKASLTGKFWKFVHYGVGRDGYIDYDQVVKLAKIHRPKMIVCGATAYPRVIDFKKFARITKTVKAYLMADISHVAGLIAGKQHPSPFPYADVVTGTTHKTLRGPRGAFIISRKKIAPEIDRAVFPGLQGGPHLHTIAAMATAFEEDLRPPFSRYARQVVKNAKTLATELGRLGFRVVSEGTDNHLMLLDLTPLKLSGRQGGALLEQAGIIVNKNMIPGDTRKPRDPSGIRLGTPAVTTRGMKEKEMKQIARLIAAVLIEKAGLVGVKQQVKKITAHFPID